MAYSMKIASFILGGAFFFCWPIASRYPKYRYLVSPFKWAFWDIPTDAERAFRYLRNHAQIARESLIERETDRVHHFEQDSKHASQPIAPDITVDGIDSEQDEDWHSVDSTTSILDGMDFVSYRAFSEGDVGRLIVYSGGVRFVRSWGRKELWRRSFLELVEMRKKDGSSGSKVSMFSSLQSLEIKFLDSSKVLVEGMRERDAAFSTILGLSGLMWQSLQQKTISKSYWSL
ncbi:MAG: hypothetical protein Q9168_000753 [Polycauliona sp. 1 TL-2023]